MDGGQDGAQAQGEERTRQQGGPKAEDEQQGQKTPEQVGAPDDEEIRAALAERDEKIAELEAQVAETSKSVEAANRLAADIEAMRKANEDEHLGFELRLAGARRNDLDDDSRYQVHRKVRSFYIENADFFTSLFEDGEKHRAMMNAIG